MKQNYFYKIITQEEAGYGRVNKFDKPIVEHNIDESKIIKNSDLKIKLYEKERYLTYDCFSTIDNDILNTIIKPNLIYPTQYEIPYNFDYLGAVIIRSSADNDIMTYVYKYEDKNILIPTFALDEVSSYWRKPKVMTITISRIKVFMTKEEIDAYQQKLKKKRDDKRQKISESYEATKRLAPVFSFKTPEFKVIEVVKKTNYLKNIQVGDIFYAELPVISGTDDRKFGNLKGIGTQTNWLKLYINNKFTGEISPKTFPQLFFQNVVVEEI